MLLTLETSQAFRKGVVNTLVCTCIGEEGLDVGEVDLIVHYDVVQSAIRNVQRSGRTGRKRAVSREKNDRDVSTKHLVPRNMS